MERYGITYETSENTGKYGIGEIFEINNTIIIENINSIDFNHKEDFKKCINEELFISNNIEKDSLLNSISTSDIKRFEYLSIKGDLELELITYLINNKFNIDECKRNKGYKTTSLASTEKEANLKVRNNLKKKLFNVDTIDYKKELITGCIKKVSKEYKDINVSKYCKKGYSNYKNKFYYKFKLPINIIENKYIPEIKKYQITADITCNNNSSNIIYINQLKDYIWSLYDDYPKGVIESIKYDIKIKKLKTDYSIKIENLLKVMEDNKDSKDNIKVLKKYIIEYIFDTAKLKVKDIAQKYNDESVKFNVNHKILYEEFILNPYNNLLNSLKKKLKLSLNKNISNINLNYNVNNKSLKSILRDRTLDIGEFVLTFAKFNPVVELGINGLLYVTDTNIEDFKSNEEFYKSKEYLLNDLKTRKEKLLKSI